MSTTDQIPVRPELADGGAHFYRADLQVHTPRDTQWDGPSPTSDDDRGAWARQFVDACRSRGLHAVAISDHHDFAFVPFVQKAAAAELDNDGALVHPADRLVVFPALELTLSVPCQAILILDADFPEDRLSDVLRALHLDPVDPTLARIPQTTELPDSASITELHAKLDKNAWLKGRYIVLPNVSPGGYKTLLRQSFQTKYKDMPCVGGYLDGSIDSLFAKRPGERKILNGQDRAWGNKSLALFQTSDSRSASYEHLGKHSTWIKWSNPTAEALRQACLAQESRVAHAAPPIPNIWISRVVVTQSKFMGRVDVALNPQYTALIGGRGTGKSTILDYVRWALCDQPPPIDEDDEVGDPRIRRRALIEGTLKPVEGEVEVYFSINAIPHVVRRLSTTDDVLLKIGNGDFERVSEGMVQSLLPIQAYSQKQLSSVAVRTSELLRFITAPIRRTLEDIERQRVDVSGRLRQNYATLQRFRTLAAEVDQSRVRVQSLADQSQSLRDGLAGITDADRAVLDEKPKYDAVTEAREQWAKAIADAETAADSAKQAFDRLIEGLAVARAVPEGLSELADKTRGEVKKVLDVARDTIDGALAEVRGQQRPGSTSQATLDQLARRIREFEPQYAGVKERSSAQEATLLELADLERRQGEARQLEERQRRSLEALGDPQAAHAELRAQLLSLNADRTNALSKQCEDLTAASDGLIRAQLEGSKGFADALVKFRAAATGSSVRVAKIEAFFEQLADESDPTESWERALAELELLLQRGQDAGLTSEMTPTLTRLGLALPDQKRLASRLTPDAWLDLSLALILEEPTFEYRSKEATYIPFSAASAGQQATALLTTLLSQSGTPLLIDQPEEDLDSDTVQRIVSSIWTAKGRRQILFASHNANLVVNGDADLVLVCAYARAGDQSAGTIKTSGAIDVLDVRKEITGVMEGGERAFRLRKEKYGF